jgi:hypothetical protein
LRRANEEQFAARKSMTQPVRKAEEKGSPAIHQFCGLSEQLTDYREFSWLSFSSFL